MDLTLIIVNYNSTEYLDALSRSIPAACRGLKYEVILVDNHSRDADDDALRRRFRDFRLILNASNRGFGTACNQGMRLARGRHIALVNPDMVLQPDCLRRLSEYLNTHPVVAAAGPQLLGDDGRVQPSCRRIPTLYHIFCESTGLARLAPRSRLFGGYRMTYWAHDEEREVEQVMGACLVARRDVLERIGYFDERFFMYYEEVDLCKRLRDAGYAIMFVPEARAVHHEGRSALTDKANALIEFYRSRSIFFLKHHGRRQYWIVKWVSFLDTGLRTLFWSLRAAANRSDVRARLFAESYLRANGILFQGSPKAGMRP